MGMSGSGGDGGAAERKATEDARQQDAIARLNRVFGAGGGSAQPEREAFTRAARPGYMASYASDSTDASWMPPEGEFFDAAGFDAAMADAKNGAVESEANRAAREGLYGRIAADSKALQLDDLGKERQLAQRDVDFDLARRGLFGGSRQVDAGRDIEDQYNRGVLTADNNAQTVANNARMADEKTRVSLINAIRSGMSDADASSAAFNAMSNNANEAANAARNQSVGGFFDAIRGAANQYQQQDAYEKAFQKYRAGGGSASGGYDGAVRNV